MSAAERFIRQMLDVDDKEISSESHVCFFLNPFLFLFKRQVIGHEEQRTLELLRRVQTRLTPL